MKIRRKSKTSVDMTPLLKRNSHNDSSTRDNFYQAWLAKDIKKFIRILNNKHPDLTYCYEELDNLTIVDLIVQSPEHDDFLQAVKDCGHNFNTRNALTGKAAAHYAAEVGNTTALRLLLDAGADLNIQESEGDTPLHILVARWDSTRPCFEEALQLLLSRDDVTVNVPNNKGLTPITLAAAATEAEVIAEFLRLGATLDLDTFRNTEDNKTSREVILKNLPGLEEELPEGPWEADPLKGILDFKFRLFYYLKIGQEIKFCQAFREVKAEADIKALLTSCDGQQYTYLQHACEKGCIKAVRALNKAGADVNLAAPGTPTPILLATQTGRFDIVASLLADKDIDLAADSSGETLLHAIVKGQGKTYNHYQILRRLVRHPKIDINAKDNKGRTALHYAVQFADERTIFYLIDNGAKLDAPNNFGETPLCQISSTTLKKYLDSKISTNKEVPKHVDFSYIIDYQFASSKAGNHIYGANTDLLSKMACSPELRGLLSHPVYSTIILFKWQRVRWFFYLDLFFYSMFCVLLTSYLLFGPTIADATGHQFETSSTNSSTNNYSDPFSNSTSILSKVYGSGEEHYILVVETFLLVFAVVLAISEFFQFLGTPLYYFASIENWLQMAVVITSVMTITLGCPQHPRGVSHCNELNAFAIFFAWFEFFFVVGKHPKLTFYVDMFRTASWFLLRFLVVHTSLILAFAFSFHIMFRDHDSPFTTVPKSLFKTIVMITGEFEFGEIPLQSVPITSHILFGIFLFLVAIVLFNLLIGLAVSATRPIEDDAFLYSCIAQVPIIAFFEDIFFNDSHFGKRLVRKFLSCTGFTKEVYQHHITLIVYPNQQNRMELRLTEEQESEKVINIRHHLTPKIVADTQYIITNQQDALSKKCGEFEELKSQVAASQNALEEELKSLKTGLVEILEKIEKRAITDADGKIKKCKKADAVLKKLRSYGMKREPRAHKFAKNEENLRNMLL